MPHSHAILDIATYQIAKLRVVKGIVKLGPELKRRIFPDSADRRHLGQGHIPVVLAWPEDISEPQISEADSAPDPVDRSVLALINGTFIYVQGKQMFKLNRPPLHCNLMFNRGHSRRDQNPRDACEAKFAGSITGRDSRRRKSVERHRFPCRVSRNCFR